MARKRKGEGAVRVKGLPQLRTTMEDAGVALGQLDTAHSRVADVVAAGVKAPRLTGRLQASIRPFPGTGTGAVVGSDVPYARVQEGRYKYLRKGVQKTAPQWMGIYEQEVAAVCDTVRGE